MEGGLAQTQTQIMPKKGWLPLLSVLAVDGLFWLSRILSLPAKGNWEEGKRKLVSCQRQQQSGKKKQLVSRVYPGRERVSERTKAEVGSKDGRMSFARMSRGKPVFEEGLVGELVG